VKTEPQWLIFGFSPKSPHPRAVVDPHFPALKPRFTPHQMGPLYPILSPPALRSRNRVPVAPFLIVHPNPPPLHISRYPPPSPSTLAYPAQNRSPLSIANTPHAQFAKAKPLRVGFLFIVYFWSIAPIFTFSTIHKLVFAPVYILLYLHICISSIHNTWSPIQRGVII
jgi:hypothetical protein